MGKSNQELYCWECKHYFDMPLLNGFNGIVKMICPCGHHHQRNVKDGRIVEEGRYTGDAVEEIIIPKSARYKESKIAKMRKKFDERDGVEIKPEDEGKENARNNVMAELWLDYYGPNSERY